MQTEEAADTEHAEQADPLFGELSLEQRKVVLAPPGPLLVLAGAGSGKTRALTHRVAYFLRQGLSPDRVLLATFTNQAARQMLARLALHTSKPLTDMWAGTFHGLALRAVRQFGQQLGLSPRSAVLDQADAVDLFAVCLHETPFPVGVFLPRPSFLQGLWSLSVVTEEPLEAVLLARAPTLLPHRQLLSKVCDRYMEKKVRMGVCDFDDLLLAWRLILSDCREARERMQSQFLHVFVDEYQDVSPLQSILADDLAAQHRSLTVVGDDAQSIYRFRGADLRALHSFSLRWPDACRIHLSTNFRSQPDIVALSNRCLLSSPPGQLLPRPPMRALDTPSLSVRPAVVQVPDVRFQTAFVLSRIRELVKNGQRLGQIAVLYRHHRQVRELSVDLLRAGIPYVVRSGQRLMEQTHVKDVLAFLRVLLDPQDELSWTRVLRQVEGLGPTGRAEVLKALLERQRRGEPLHFWVPPKTRQVARKNLARLHPLFGALRQCMEQSDAASLVGLPGRLFELVVAKHYRDYASRHFTDAASRVKDLAAFSDPALPQPVLAQNALPLADEGAKTVLRDFLSALTLGTFDSSTAQDQLVLSSVHQAKGLEWDVVFLLWLAEGYFPSVAALSENEDPLSQGGEAEERRLFYVAITRARRELYLCCPDTSPTQGTLRVSRYVAELCGETPLCERGQVTAP